MTDGLRTRRGWYAVGLGRRGVGDDGRRGRRDSAAVGVIGGERAGQSHRIIVSGVRLTSEARCRPCSSDSRPSVSVPSVPREGGYGEALLGKRQARGVVLPAVRRIGRFVHDGCGRVELAVGAGCLGPSAHGVACRVKTCHQVVGDHIALARCRSAIGQNVPVRCA